VDKKKLKEIMDMIKGVREPWYEKSNAYT